MNNHRWRPTGVGQRFESAANMVALFNPGAGGTVGVSLGDAKEFVKRQSK